MLISYQHRFLFIHIYKVAGSSISKALEDYVHRPERLRVLRLLRRSGLPLPLPFYKLKMFPAHISICKVQQALPAQIFNSLFKFAFVRNPWDWQVSLYHYMLQEPTHHQHELITAMSGFEEYLEWRVSCEKRLQKDFIADEAGNLLVDFVGKYENLANDLARICERLGVQADLPHLRKSVHRDYRDYYNQRTIKLIEEHFQPDIECFGYTYE